MRPGARHAVALLALCAVGTGCASLDPEPDWKQTQALVETHSGVVPTWTRTEAEAAETRARTAALVEDGLTRQDAVQIALINAPQLQAQFDALGLARADTVQAGLYSNPQLGGYVGFPLSLDGSAITLLTFLSDLWIVPARVAVAEANLEGTIQSTGAATLAVIFETTQTYDTVLYQQALLEIEQRELDLRRGASERMSAAPVRERERLVRETTTSASLGDQEIAVAQATRDLALARNHLVQVLNLDRAQQDVALLDPLAEPGEDAWSVERAVDFALERRLDLAAARLAIEAARRRGELARRSRMTQVGAGPGYNGGFGTDDNWGPSISLEVPIFDWNQASEASANFQELQARHQLAALEAMARREVSDALAERQLQRSQAEILRIEVLPARERLLVEAGPEGPKDLAEYLHWMKAQEDAIDSRRSYVTAVWSLRQAHSDFRRALYGGSAQGK